MNDARRPRLSGLYVITDARVGDAAALFHTVTAALRGGARVIQYRDKGTDGERRLSEARAVVEACREHRAVSIINDDIELALAVGADGVHLGEHDGALKAARERLGDHMLVGISCYDSLDRAVEAEAGGADYVAFGSFYPSPTKPGARRAPIDLLTRARTMLKVPIVAIGGIDAANAAPLVEAGADALAVISAVCLADDPRAAAFRLAALYGPA